MVRLEINPVGVFVGGNAYLVGIAYPVNGYLGAYSLFASTLRVVMYGRVQPSPFL